MRNILREMSRMQTNLTHPKQRGPQVGRLLQRWDRESLKRLRALHAESPEQFSKRMAGVVKGSSLRNWESGRMTPNVHTLELIAQRMGIDITFFFMPAESADKP
jgi:transcriptional regulator with XRE-family HTH domain